MQGLSPNKDSFGINKGSSLGEKESKKHLHVGFITSLADASNIPRF